MPRKLFIRVQANSLLREILAIIQKLITTLTFSKHSNAELTLSKRPHPFISATNELTKPTSAPDIAYFLRMCDL